MATRFKDRVGLVTGAAGGLGATYAYAMAKEGASIIAVDVVESAATVDAVRSLGREALGLRADLTDEAQVRQMVAEAAGKFGRIDVLVNNAGGGRVARRADCDDLIDLQQWRALMEMNLTSTVLCCNFVAPHMRRNGYGRIVNVSSRAARGVGRFSAVSTGYICSKIGVIGLTRDLATRLGPDGITVNCIVPAFVISGPNMQARWDAMSEAERARMVAETPLRRLPDPQEIANVVLFLASDEASYITAAAIDVNGGSAMS